MTPFHLTLDAVKKAAREAHAAGKLTAQHPDRSLRMCVYDGADDCRCAVGAALPPGLVPRGWQGHPLWQLKMRNVVDFPKEEGPAIELIQTAHDRWAKAEDIDRPKCEAKFLELIQ
jgi:hypothetical protein